MAFFRLELLLCIIFIFCSLQQSDAQSQIAIHQGKLSRVNCSTAILGMTGDSIHKAIWWQFLPLSLQSYLQAFRVYMVLPQIECNNIEKQLQELGGLLSTRNASIAEDTWHIKGDGLGSMTISMWMMGFFCPERIEDACKMLTPTVLLKNPTSKRYDLYSVWELDGEVVRNTAAARIPDLPNRNLEVQHFNDHITFRSIGGGVPFCGNRHREPRIALDIVPVNRNCSENKPVPEQLKNLCISRENTTTIVENLIASFMFQVKTSYIQAQTSAVNLEQGLITEFWVAAIAMPGAFIAVVAAALPITDYLLKIIRQRLSHLMKTLLICIVNSVFAFLSYGAVISLVPSELKRQGGYETWGLLADEVPVLSPRGLQVLVAIQAKSDYKSKILILVWVTFALLIPIMLSISCYRCNQVANRQKLLRTLRRLRPEEPFGDERLDDLRALAMTDVEQEELLEQLQPNEQNAVSVAARFLRSLRRMLTLSQYSWGIRRHRRRTQARSRAPGPCGAAVVAP